MSKNEINPQPKQSEEIDLGQLFKMIGNMFDRFFRFIGSIFKLGYKLLILISLHFYKRLYWYIGATFIGLILGFVAEKYSDKEYGANMFIETNFNSSRQAYEVIKEFNQLANVDKDSIELATRLNISVKEAKSLKAFYIDADIDDTQLMQQFINYKSELDSIIREETTFEDFKKQQSDYNFKNHKIGVVATDKFVFKKINNGLIAEFLDNDYINEIKKVTLENIDKREKTIDLEIQSLDSLMKTYLEIRKRESEKEYTSSQGTNLYMSGVEKNDLIKDETEIIDKISTLENEKQDLAIMRVENNQQINIISNFPDSGYNVDEPYDKKYIILPIIFLSFIFLFFAFIGLGKFLKRQDDANWEK